MCVVTRRTLYVLSWISLTATLLPVTGQVQAQAQAAAPSATCRNGQRDDFTGAQLDRRRWGTIVRETSALQVRDGHLVLPTTSTDLILRDEPLTPNIVLQALPAGPFTATAKLALAPRYAWDQAGLIIYRDDDHYAKLVFQARGNGKPEARYFEFLVEKNAKGASGSKSEKLGAAFPDSAWVRLTSDGRTLRAAYSGDGMRFTEMPESKGRGANDSVVTVIPTLDSLVPVKIGLFALSGRGDPPNPVLDAKFDWFEVCPAQVTGW